MKETQAVSHKIRIDVSLAPGDKVTWDISDGAEWSIIAGKRSDGFSIRAAGGGSPPVLSVGQMSLSTSQLSITAGQAQLTATIIAHMMAVTGSTVTGTTNSSDSGLSAVATYGDDIQTELVDDWNLSF